MDIGAKLDRSKKPDLSGKRIVFPLASENAELRRRFMSSLYEEEASELSSRYSMLLSKRLLKNEGLSTERFHEEVLPHSELY